MLQTPCVAPASLRAGHEASSFVCTYWIHLLGSFYLFGARAAGCRLTGTQGCVRYMAGDPGLAPSPRRGSTVLSPRLTRKTPFFFGQTARGFAHYSTNDNNTTLRASFTRRLQRNNTDESSAPIQTRAGHRRAARQLITTHRFRRQRRDAIFFAPSCQRL